MRLMLALIFLANLVFSQETAVKRIPPSFPGGEDSLKYYLKRNTVFPKEYLDSDKFTECTVSVKFRVDESGELKDIMINKGCFGFDRCDLEALRLVKQMPKWEPAREDGKATKRGFSVNIPFKKPKNP